MVHNRTSQRVCIFIFDEVFLSLSPSQQYCCIQKRKLCVLSGFELYDAENQAGVKVLFIISFEVHWGAKKLLCQRLLQKQSFRNFRFRLAPVMFHPRIGINRLYQQYQDATAEEEEAYEYEDEDEENVQEEQ